MATGAKLRSRLSARSVAPGWDLSQRWGAVFSCSFFASLGLDIYQPHVDLSSNPPPPLPCKEGAFWSPAAGGNSVGKGNGTQQFPAQQRGSHQVGRTTFTDGSLSPVEVI